MGETRVRRAVVLAGLLLAGCAQTLPVDARGNRTALPPVVTYSAPHSAPPAPPEPVVPPVQAPAADTCQAADLAYLVGKPRAEIPVPVNLTRRRVICEHCPVTLDQRPERQTIFYDPDTKIVTRITCG